MKYLYFYLINLVTLTHIVLFLVVYFFVKCWAVLYSMYVPQLGNFSPVNEYLNCFWLIWIKMLWLFLYKSLNGICLYFPWEKYLEVELPDCEVEIYFLL